MYKAVKSIAPATIIVWAPNLGHDYPYGQTANIEPNDMALLDTNKNGQLDRGDDPYMPYYPGDDYVDWIGISVCQSSSSPAHSFETFSSDRALTSDLFYFHYLLTRL